jgi:hypothetical protein
MADGQYAWTWTWFHMMSERQRLRFDGFLVRVDDPLAYKAGSPQSRFEERVTRMVELELDRRAQKGYELSSQDMPSYGIESDHSRAQRGAQGPTGASGSGTSAKIDGPLDLSGPQADGTGKKYVFNYYAGKVHGPYLEVTADFLVRVGFQLREISDSSRFDQENGVFYLWGGSQEGTDSMYFAQHMRRLGHTAIAKKHGEDVPKWLLQLPSWDGGPEEAF